MKAFLAFLLISALIVVYYGSIKDDNASLDFRTFVDTIYYSIKAMIEGLNRSFNVDGRFSKPMPDYQLQVTEVKSLKECIQIDFDVKEPCLLVRVDFRNDDNESVMFELQGKNIITKDGRQLEKYGGLYNTKQLNGLCDSITYFKLFPNARKDIGMCFPSVAKDDAPVLYIGVLANGKKKEHRMELISYFS